jgi:repressor LexA
MKVELSIEKIEVCVSGSSTPKPLPPRQKEVLAFIARSTARHGYAPSTLEIAAVLGVKSTFAVRKHIDALVKKGMLNHQRGLARTAVLTSAGKAALA